MALAEKVETVHGTDPNAPHGLAEALRAIVSEFEVHMKKEAQLPRHAARGCRCRRRPDRRHSPRYHDEQEHALARIAAITHGFRLPKDACRSWRRLYAGTQKLVEDLDEHIRLENDVLFPRFENTA